MGFFFGDGCKLHQRVAKACLFGIDLSLCVRPEEMAEERFGLADFVGEVLITPRLTGLALQAFDLRAELAQDVRQSGEITFSAAQPQFRLVATGVEARDARCIFENARRCSGLAFTISEI